MRWILTLFALLSLTVSTSSCNLLHHTENYPNGQVKKEGPLTIMGLQKGVWNYNYQTGQSKARGSYADDVQEGEWIYWFKNANKEMTGHFQKKRRWGFWEYWYGDGVPKARGRFHDGRETGYWTYWSREGKKIEEGDFRDGRLVHHWTYYHPNGQKKNQGYYIDGVKAGVWKSWTSNGTESQKVYALPAGYELVEEKWPDGKTKRSGFLYRSQKVGRWVSFHRNGNRRLEADYIQGEPQGPVMLWGGEGEPLATGSVERGRLSDDWSVWINGSIQPMGFDNIKPAGVHRGQWSPASLADEVGMDDVARTWLAEIGGATSEVVKMPSPNSDPEKGVVIRVPAKAQPWTVVEEEKLKYYVKAYEEGVSYRPVNIPGSKYIPVAKKDRRDDSKSRELEGKQLPWTQFQAADGSSVDLKSHHGKNKVIMVILRGFAGQVCVYCASQTKAYAKSKAFQKLDALNTKVYVVYPGPEGGVDAFLEAYSNSFGETGTKPPYRMLYDPDLALVEKWGIRSDLAIPTTIILDESGRIRWAYVGTSIEDRPSAEELILQVEKLDKD